MRLTKQFARIAAVGAAACVLNVCMPMQAFGLQTSGVIRVTGFESAKAVDSDSYDAMRQIVTAAWDSMEESADLTKLKIRRDDFKPAMRQLMMDTPAYFFVEHSYQFSYSSSSGCITKVYFTYNCTEDEVAQKRAEYDDAKQAILNQVDPGWSDVEKALFLHDTIVATTSYDLTYSNYDAYDVLVSHEAVCQGYALAYMDLMREAGVDCYYLASDELNHAWNMVEIDGSYYHVDATWDDPTPDQLGYVRHKNFLCTDEEIRALEEEEELGAYYPDGNPDFATGYSFDDLKKVRRVLVSDDAGEKAEREAREVLPSVMGSDIWEAMLDEFEGARQRVARLMDNHNV